MSVGIAEGGDLIVEDAFSPTSLSAISSAEDPD